MLYVGLDDTDTLDHPGTNQLARHLVMSTGNGYRGTLIVRHQLLQDPRVPCTRKNGCAAIAFEVAPQANREQFIAEMRSRIVAWCPVGSDPGLCVTRNEVDSVPAEVIAFGLRCQTELVTQEAARKVALKHDIFLEGLGGTEDGVIGALAAIGLLATRNDGRVIYRENVGGDLFDISGCQAVNSLLDFGVDRVARYDSGERVTTGVVDLGKRLRPNYRGGRIVLFVVPADSETANDAHWRAVRVT